MPPTQRRARRDRGPVRDLCRRAGQLPEAARLVADCPAVSVVRNHRGKPAAGGGDARWQDALAPPPAPRGCRVGRPGSRRAGSGGSRPRGASGVGAHSGFGARLAGPVRRRRRPGRERFARTAGGPGRDRRRRRGPCGATHAGQGREGRPHTGAIAGCEPPGLRCQTVSNTTSVRLLPAFRPLGAAGAAPRGGAPQCGQRDFRCRSHRRSGNGPRSAGRTAARVPCASGFRRGRRGRTAVGRAGADGPGTAGCAASRWRPRGEGGRPRRRRRP